MTENLLTSPTFLCKIPEDGSFLILVYNHVVSLHVFNFFHLSFGPSSAPCCTSLINFWCFYFLQICLGLFLVCVQGDPMYLFKCNFVLSLQLFLIHYITSRKKSCLLICRNFHFLFHLRCKDYFRVYFYLGVDLH